MPIPRPAAPQDGPTPFELAVRDVLTQLAAEIDPGRPHADLVDEAVHAIAKAHTAEISLLRRRAVRGETEAGHVLERARAYEMVADQLKLAATKFLDENARLAVHVASQTQQIQAVNELLAAAPVPEGDEDRTVRVADVLAALERSRPYPWPAQPPLVLGISVDDSYRIGWFVNLHGEMATHLFVGWAVVLHSTSNTALEPLFRVHGRPVPESQLSLMGWRLDALR